MNLQHQILSFKIIKVSSEDLDHQYYNLVSDQNNNRGWQTQKNCTYPQFITFKFLQPVFVNKLQLLSHQYKISNSVEIFMGFLLDQNLKFQFLGKFSLQDNIKNHFKFRELKTVMINAPCQYLKLIFNQPYNNMLNIYNQVGVINIQFHGQNLSQQIIKHNLQKLQQSQQNNIQKRINHLQKKLNQFKEYEKKHHQENNQNRFTKAKSQDCNKNTSQINLDEKTAQDISIKQKKERKYDYDFDNTPIPTILKNQKQRQQNNTQNVYENLNYFEQNLNESLQQVFTKEFLNMSFSHNWKDKFQCTNQILQYLNDEQSISNLPNEFILIEDMNLAIHSIWNLTDEFIYNLIPKINQNGLKILRQILCLQEKNLINLDKYKHDMVFQISQKIDNIQDYKEELNFMEFSQIVKKLLHIKWLKTEILIKNLFKNYQQNNHIILILKCQLIQHIKDYLQIEQEELELLVDFGCFCMQNHNKKTRNQGRDLIAMLCQKYDYQYIIDKVQSKNLRPKIFSSLLKKIQTSQKNIDQQETINLYAQNSKTKLSQFTQQDLPKQETSINQDEFQLKSDLQVCQFCFSFNIEDDEDYEDHILNQCPMLTTCEKCDELIEIKLLTEHRLIECIYKDIYSQCPQCKSLVSNEQFENHLEILDCQCLQKNQILCPLCNKQINILINENQTWHNHIIIKKCDKNIRNFSNN